jgi:hypothetical protein
MVFARPTGRLRPGLDIWRIRSTAIALITCTRCPIDESL